MAMLLPPTTGNAKPDPNLFPKSVAQPQPQPQQVAMLPPPQAVPVESAQPVAAQKPSSNDVRGYSNLRQGQIADELSSIRSPQVPTLQEPPAPPKYQQTSPFAGIAPVMMILAGIASGKTRQPATTMLNSFAAFNKARQEGDKERLAAAQTAWKDAAQQVMDANKTRMDAYNAIVSGNKEDQRALHAELTALYTADKDYAMLDKLDSQNGYMLAQQQHMSMMDATAKLKEQHDAISKGVVPGTANYNPAMAGNPDFAANPKLPQNEFHVEIKDPIQNTAIRPGDRAKANLKISTDNDKILATAADNADATRNQDAEMERFEALAKTLPPAWFNRPLTSLAGTGYSSLLDEANKINIKQSLAAAPKAAGRNLGVKMEQLLMQASPGPNITAEASLNLIKLQKALNANLRDRTEFINYYTQPQTDAQGRDYIPKAADAEAAWQRYLDHAGDRVDVDGKMVKDNPDYLPWQEFFPVDAAAQAGKVPLDKAMDFYRIQRAKGVDPQEVISTLAAYGEK